MRQVPEYCADRLQCKGILDVLRKLKSRRGVGPTNMRNDYLRALAADFEDAVAAQVGPRLVAFTEAMVNLELPPWFYRVTAAACLLALYKEASQAMGAIPAIRPIAVGDYFYHAATRCVLNSQREVQRGFF